MKSEYLIISDVHLGSKYSKAKELLEVLRKYKAKKIIIAGDLFDHHNLYRLNKTHWKVLSKLRKLSKRCKIIYLIGNHCFLKAEFMSILLGFRCKDEYEFIIKDKKFLVLHGDIFDLYFTKYKFFTNILVKFYYFLRKLNPYAEDFFKKNFNTLCEKTSNIKKNALIYCNQKKKDYIICGHSHFPEQDNEYLNTGSFCEERYSFITISKNGLPILHYEDKKN